IHAVGVARELGIKRVIVPPAPGVFSAFGLLRADIEQHAARTVLTSTAEPDLDRINTVIDGMRDELTRVLVKEGYASDSVGTTTFADLRYRGQSSEITVPLDELALTESGLRKVEQRFEEEFEKTYGHRSPHKQFELVTIRMVASVSRRADHSGQWAADAGGDAQARNRTVYFGSRHGSHTTQVLRRPDLTAEPQSGPMIVQEYDTSVVVPPHCSAILDAHGNIVIEVSHEAIGD
ncbi:MAG TPA: hydantoinase/oxoprolinase family protein, partial [Bordetella sp.]|nr:hydantoinase/oxoprolinase family protein [Bordetella sp.]